ncbi:RbsD/FucU family protein [Evansella sp. AB-rgal1]|uniref:RbsD/FucU family protein n=1 Tax=Evansella sp. AB-rgal1 TaxID=3242696 RepID=UPI00359E803A
MLKGIPTIFSPELLKTLYEMGHGDEIVIADGNFPAASLSKRLIRYDGHDVPELLEAIIKFFPLDTYVEQPVTLMEVVKGDPPEPTIWKEYQSIIRTEGCDENNIAFLDRHSFYERAKNAYAIVATSEKALYANILLTKGVVKD